MYARIGRVESMFWLNVIRSCPLLAGIVCGRRYFEGHVPYCDCDCTWCQSPPLSSVTVSVNSKVCIGLETPGAVNFKILVVLPVVGCDLLCGGYYRPTSACECRLCQDHLQ